MDEPEIDLRNFCIAPQDEVDAREAQIDEFIVEVVGIEHFLVTDESTLSDFLEHTGYDDPDPEAPLELDPGALERVREAVLRRYGFALGEEHCHLPLWQLVDLLEESRSRRGRKPN